MRRPLKDIPSFRARAASPQAFARSSPAAKPFACRLSFSPTCSLPILLTRCPATRRGPIKLTPIHMGEPIEHTIGLTFLLRGPAEPVLSEQNHRVPNSLRATDTLRRACRASIAYLGEIEPRQRPTARAAILLAPPVRALSILKRPTHQKDNDPIALLPGLMRKCKHKNARPDAI